MHPIAFHRKANGWTQTDLGEQMGVSLTSVQAWERGATPRPRLIPKLAEVLGVDATELLRSLGDWQSAGTEDGKGNQPT